MQVPLLKQRIDVVSKEISLDTLGNKEYQQAEAIYKRLIARVIKQLDLISSVSQSVQKQVKTIDEVYLQQKKRGLRARHHLPHTLDENGSCWLKK